jgi:uncharacterized protein YjbI with pentapeptide repeats
VLPGPQPALQPHVCESETMGLETINTHTPIAPEHTAKVDLEILLEDHCEWVKSRGQNGRQADLSRLNFEGADLSDINLQDAVMNETVLKGADLLLTDLQGASLLQANFENANLLGAKLRDANLQGATLTGATGLQSAELAGTDLTFAKLPAEISPAEELKDVVRMARNATWLIGAMLVLNVLAGGRVLTASDAQILGNAPALPFPALRNGLPLVQFFLFCPVLIGGLYLWLHVYLQRLWDATAALPAIFQDGRRLDAALPWLVSWPARSYSKWLRERNRGLAAVEKTICIVLLYWVAPLTMMLFWARYLTLQDLRGTVLHVLLMAAAASAAIHFPRAAARAFQSDNYESFSETFPRGGEGSVFESARKLWSPRGARSESSATEAGNAAGPHADSLRGSSFFDPKGIAADAKTTASDAKKSTPENKTCAVTRKTSSPEMPLAIGFGLILCLLSIGTIGGAPHGGNPEQGISPGSVHTWAADAFWLIGYDPYAQVTEAEISRKPSGWTEEELNRVEGASLNGLRLRHINAYGAFFAKARLRQADLRYAYLSEADLRQANLRQASLRFAVLYQAKLSGAMLQEADLQNANLTRAELVKSDLSFASLAGALLLDAKLDGAVLYSANLRNASLQRASMEQADLREANLEGANLSMADLREAYLSSAKLAGAKLPQGKFNGAILMGADLRRTDLSNSSFQGAVLSGADFTGASLQSADLRGGVGLIASQICAAANLREAQMDDALAGEVGARCGGVR